MVYNCYHHLLEVCWCIDLSKLYVPVNKSTVLHDKSIVLLRRLFYQDIMKAGLNIKTQKDRHTFQPPHTVLQIRCREPIWRVSVVDGAEVNTHVELLP